MKIAVGLSGGVDSAVAAYLLKKQGFEVLGINLILNDSFDITDVKAVSEFLGIETKYVDLREYFKNEVIENFKSEYQNGKTPSPCIICNEKIKFGKMLDIAKENGCEKIATGHYADIVEKDGKYLLKKADSVKDQSYFLYRLSQEQLKSICFPLKNMSKDEIRAIANEANIPVANKKDSLEICFVPDDDYVSFLLNNGVTSPNGDFVNTKGEKIGRHNGIINYTVGQRKGLGAFGKPMFVTEINASENKVVLGENGEQYKDSLKADNVKYIANIPAEPFEAYIKIRYKAPPVKAKIIPSENGFFADFDTPQRSVTPGQSAVIYDENGYVLGGGIIV